VAVRQQRVSLTGWALGLFVFAVPMGSLSDFDSDAVAETRSTPFSCVIGARSRSSPASPDLWRSPTCSTPGLIRTICWSKDSRSSYAARRHPNCAGRAHSQFDMCRNDRYIERGINHGTRCSGSLIGP
jgi:hypothetical protein